MLVFCDIFNDEVDSKNIIHEILTFLACILTSIIFRDKGMPVNDGLYVIVLRTSFFSSMI